MALIRTGATIGAISGNLGSLNFVNSSRSPYVRTRGRRIARTSPAAYDGKRHYKKALQLWWIEGEDVRKAWVAAATTMSARNRLGISRTFSGFTLWMFVQLTRLRAGLSSLEYPPAELSSEPVTSISIDSGDQAFINVETDATHIGPTWTRLYYGSRTGKDHLPAQATYWRFLEASTSTFANINVIGAWNATLGNPTIGEYIRIAVRTIKLENLPSRRIVGSTATVPFP